MSNQHAGPASPTDLPPIPEPTHSERARTLLHISSVGSLSTISRRQPGFPFGSLMPYTLDAAGRPLFLISNMAMHTQNLKADPRASLLVTQAAADGDVLGAARVTIVGNVALIPAEDKAEARSLYLDRHANARYWVDFDDFHFFRLNPLDLYYVGGFGVMGWVTAPDYAEALPDPLADDASGILAHMNADHADSLLLLTLAHTSIDAASATMTAIDRLGFHVAAKTADGIKGARIAFPRQALTPAETRTILVEMVRNARENPQNPHEDS